jgi:xanthine dehydrogenase accessory factor
VSAEESTWTRGDAQWIYALLAEMAARGEEGAVATVIRTARSVPRHAGSKMVLRADGSVTGSVGGGVVEARVLEAARETARDGQCRRLLLELNGEAGVCGGETEIFVEPVTVSAPCWVIGAGHVGRALVELGRSLPLHFTVVDDRAEFLTDLGPAEPRLATPEELAEQLNPTARTVVILANRHHELDGAYLEAVFAAEARTGQEAAYVGVVGSRRKAQILAERFAGSSPQHARFARVRTPVGLALGAETPTELALSILGELLAVLRDVEWVQSEDGTPLGVFCQRHRPLRKDLR